MTNLVVVSNRVAVPGLQKKAGGLATAIEASLRRRGGTWLGWNGLVADQFAASHVDHVYIKGVRYLTFSLSNQEYDNYYNGFANGALWPALHYREDLIRYTDEMVNLYRGVNERFASHTADAISGDDVVWVHDYHLFGLGAALRRRRISNRLGFFLHVPFPPREIIAALPNKLRLAEALASYDVIGVQTSRDAENISRYLDWSFEHSDQCQNRSRGERASPRIEVCPVGVRPQFMSRAARLASKHTLANFTSAGLANKAVMVSAERLDYSKGIPQRLGSYEAFLSRYPEWRRRICLLQIAPLSREGLHEYGDIAKSVDGLAGRINGRYGDVGWSPVHYTNKFASPFVLAGIFRRARIALVTPLRDGMNLVAKEYIAAQNPCDPGVLILSKFAGAAEQLTAALIVDPRDSDAVALSIKHGLDMPIDERKQRHAELMANVTYNNAERWCSGFVGLLEG